MIKQNFNTRCGLIIILLVGSINRFANGQYTDVVDTTTGPMIGQILTTFAQSREYAAFSRIPYAKPPIGYLRFKPPVPIEPWDEVLNATIEDPRCPQLLSRSSYIIVGVEDCLYLNVYTPVTDLSQVPRELKSVMLWVHGGAWEEGWSDRSQYSPDYMIDRDTVVVSFNYRCGPFGFMNLEHPNATGNAALKDQLLVFKWVQANIESFGGDPSNVTIFGVSTGGMSVGFHLLSDASVGLFHAAVMMSGTPLNPWALQPSEKSFRLSTEVANYVMGTQNITDKAVLLEGLYSASTYDVVDATYSIRPLSANFSQVILFGPTIEDPAISDDPFITLNDLNKYVTGNFIQVPIIIGYLENEMVTFCDSVHTLYTAVFDSTLILNDIGLPVPQALIDFMDSEPNDLSDLDTEVLDTLIRRIVLYRSLKGQFVGMEGVGMSLKDLFLYHGAKETSAVIFIIGVDLVQRLIANHSDYPVYYYDITFYTNRSIHNVRLNNSYLGAGHADDIEYIFSVPSLDLGVEPGDSVSRTIDWVATMWTNLAKHGNPTPDWIEEDTLNITWPDSRVKDYAVIIGDELTVEPRPLNSGAYRLELYEWIGFCRYIDCD